jgi:hypothetical protein
MLIPILETVSQSVTLERIPNVLGQIMELLGPSLWDLLHSKAVEMTVQYVACAAVEALRILQDLHERGCAPPRWVCAGLHLVWIEEAVSSWP